LYFISQAHGAHPTLPSFPTRRSSDLARAAGRRGDCRGTRPRRLRGGACQPAADTVVGEAELGKTVGLEEVAPVHDQRPAQQLPRSEEHTSELQSPCNLVCRLLLEKKK